MSQRRSYIAARAGRAAIYAAGGMVGETGRPLATFQRFDPATDSWTGLERLPEPMSAAAGGGDRPDDLRHRRPGRGAGHGRAGLGLDTRRSGAGARRAAAGARASTTRPSRSAAKLYVLGGYVEREEHDEVYVYDPARNRWSLVHAPAAADPRVRRGRRSAASSGRSAADAARRCCARSGSSTRGPAAGAAGRRCRSRWSCSARRSPATQIHAIWEHDVPGLRHEHRSLAPGPVAARNPPRARAVRVDGSALHGRRLHHRAPRLPGRRAALAPLRELRSLSQALREGPRRGSRCAS